MSVPFQDLSAHHAAIKDEVLAKIGEVIERNAFAGGPYVESFENAFSAYCGVEHAIGVGSGTESLWLSLLSNGIGPGDEVITTPTTFIATAEAISLTGARPVFVDVCERSGNINPENLEKAITRKTKAIIPVHLYGQMADMDPVMEIARKYCLLVIEDAAQAVGARYNGEVAGSMGICGSFSFYPGKNLGAFGEAGAIITNDADLAAKVRVLRNHGQARKYVHSKVGWNCRMDGIQAAVLEIKLRGIDQANERRRYNANRYIEKLSRLNDIALPLEEPRRKHVYHLFPIRVHDRDRVLAKMAEARVDCAIHYPIPLHLQGAYNHLGYKKGDFPVSERWASECLSLPIYPELTEEQIEHVVDSLANVLATPVANQSQF